MHHLLPAPACSCLNCRDTGLGSHRTHHQPGSGGGRQHHPRRSCAGGRPPHAAGAGVGQGSLASTRLAGHAGSRPLAAAGAGHYVSCAAVMGSSILARSCGSCGRDGCGQLQPLAPLPAAPHVAAMHTHPSLLGSQRASIVLDSVQWVPQVHSISPPHQPPSGCTATLALLPLTLGNACHITSVLAYRPLCPPDINFAAAPAAAGRALLVTASPLSPVPSCSSRLFSPPQPTLTNRATTLPPILASQPQAAGTRPNPASPTPEKSTSTFPSCSRAAAPLTHGSELTFLAI
jgi:hypothetical protein